ncbi:MAG: amino acid deaminase [Caulobacteraceae bacterium]
MKPLTLHPLERPLDPREKGVPGNAGEVALSAVGAQNWHLLAEDLPLPAAVIKLDALRANSTWMKGFLAQAGAAFAPHGKTSLSPALFNLQIEDGAWGMTLSTPHHLHVARSFGFNRILLANQLVGRSAIEWVVDELNRDPGFEFYCLLDSLDNLAQLAAIARRKKLERPLRVLVEIGFMGGRTGCRTVEAALEVARATVGFSDVIALSGVEGFEGIMPGTDEADRLGRVERFLDQMVTVAHACAAETLFAPGEVLFTAGGSGFFDLVAEKLGSITVEQDHKVVLRSGCYLTHDAVMYTWLFESMKRRRPDLPQSLGELRPALEVWGYVQSTPEPGRVIVALGKRDISYDQLPRPTAWFRPGEMTAPVPAPEEHRVVELNDQHCHVTTPAETPWRVGDMVAFGISHPCLTFDKWRVIHLVDDNYRVVGSIRTYF